LRQYYIQRDRRGLQVKLASIAKHLLQVFIN